eukprot:102631-Rhodomonas_salina.1
MLLDTNNPIPHSTAYPPGYLRPYHLRKTKRPHRKHRHDPAFPAQVVSRASFRVFDSGAISGVGLSFQRSPPEFGPVHALWVLCSAHNLPPLVVAAPVWTLPAAPLPALLC